MGADNTTLLVTNGKKIWIRNVPIGGNHFTRALTKEMKLTFAKAEHLKCNATKSPDPRAVFQALRPVFNDYVAEIQRSIGFFANVNRNAKIGRLIGVGNGFKLAGLQKFLQQNLQYEVERVDHFQGVVGDIVLTAPMFQDNLLTFVVPYGLALQGLGLTDIHTTLLPREIALARKIRRKKPWAAATAASLLIGMAASTAGYGNVWHSVSEARFGEAEKKAKDLEGTVGSLKSKYSGEEGRNTTAKAAGDKLVSTLPTRELWLEVYKAIDECLPRDIGKQIDVGEETPSKKNQISLEGVVCKKYDDLSTWFSTIDPDKKTSYMRKEDADTAPSGIGYVFTLNGHHYHNDADDPIRGQGHNYVKNTLLENLKKDQIEVKDSLSGEPIGKVDVRRLGITHAVPVWTPAPTDVQFYPHGRPGSRRTAAGGAGFGSQPFGGGGLNENSGFAPGAPNPGAFSGGAQPRSTLEFDDKSGSKPIQIKLTRFRIEFVWKPTPAAARVSLTAPDAADPNTAPVDPSATTTPPAGTQPAQ